jgi:hypothetical protein
MVDQMACDWKAASTDGDVRKWQNENGTGRKNGEAEAGSRHRDHSSPDAVTRKLNFMQTIHG